LVVTHVHQIIKTVTSSASGKIGKSATRNRVNSDRQPRRRCPDHDAGNEATGWRHAQNSRLACEAGVSASRLSLMHPDPPTADESRRAATAPWYAFCRRLCRCFSSRGLLFRRPMGALSSENTATAHTRPRGRNLCGAYVTLTESLRRGRVGPLASIIHTLPSHQHTPRPAKPSHPPPPPRPLASLIPASPCPAGGNFASQFFQLLRSPSYPPAPQDAATQGWKPHSLSAATVAPAARAVPLHWGL